MVLTSSTLDTAPTVIVGMATSWRIRSLNGVWYSRPYRGCWSAWTCPVETSITSHPGAGHGGGDRHRVVTVVAARHPVGGREADRQREVVGPYRPNRPHHLERVAEPVADRTAVLVFTPVAQRRQEARHQVPVGEVELEQVEAEVGASLGGGDVLVPDQVHGGRGPSPPAPGCEAPRRPPRAPAAASSRCRGARRRRHPPKAPCTTPFARHGRAAGRSWPGCGGGRSRRSAPTPPAGRRPTARCSRA